MDTRLTALVWLSTAVDVLLLALLAASARVLRPRRRGSQRSVPVAGALVLALLAAVAVLWAAKIGVLLRLGLDPGFGIMHVIYLDFVVAGPVAGLVLLASWRQRPRVGRLLLGLLLLAPAPFGAYATFIEPRRLVVERAVVPVVPERGGKAPVRVGVLADLQTAEVGDHERAAVNRLMALRPDVILLPGDILQRPGRLEDQLPGLRALMDRLRAPGGVFLVLGDQDTPKEVEPMVRGTRVEVLVDRIVRRRVRDRLLTVGGLEVEWRNRRARATAAALEARPGREDVRVLLAHRPDPALDLPPGTRVDLVVAGHTHGGQLQLPLLGPPLIASAAPRAVGAGGLHTLEGGRRIYVSRGVGMERHHAPPLRFGAPPEVSLLEVGRELNEDRRRPEARRRSLQRSSSPKAAVFGRKSRSALTSASVAVDDLAIARIPGASPKARSSAKSASRARSSATEPSGRLAVRWPSVPGARARPGASHARQANCTPDGTPAADHAQHVR